MSPLADLNGYSVPLSPRGKSQIVGSTPWSFSVDIVALQFRTDPDQILKLLPEPLELSQEQPDVAYVWFGDWQGIWSGAEDMLAVNPERVQYKECLLGVRCRCNGMEGHRVVYIWVDKDFSMARGWFMGFPKKFGQIYLGTENRHLHDLNPALPGVVPGARYGVWCAAHGERLVSAHVTLKKKIQPKELPSPFGTDLFHTVHFPSADVDNKKPLVHQLVQTVSADMKFGEIWECDGDVEFHGSDVEELTDIAPKEVLSAYVIPVGFNILGTRLIREY